MMMMLWSTGVWLLRMLRLQGRMSLQQVMLTWLRWWLLLSFVSDRRLSIQLRRPLYKFHAFGSSFRDALRMDDAGRERARNNEIEALRKRIEALQRERTNTTNLPTIEISDGASKNGSGAQGPSSEPTNDMDMKQYIRNALAIISGFAERLEQQSDSALTRSETS